MFEPTAVQVQEIDVQMHWGVKIPMRDGVCLSATLYLPEPHREPGPVVFTLTPYVAQTYHHFATYFAQRGLPFLTVDVRGRGNSEGTFRPNIQEARDGHDIVEWLAAQPYCNGKVSMWGGSYAGYDQWATAKEAPPHLSTIVPVAAPYIGVDFPMRNNIPGCYIVQWLTYVSGRTSQDKIFWDSQRFWYRKFLRWYESGAPFDELDDYIGNPSATFHEWVSHPEQDEYWDQYNPTSEEYSRIRFPILTITGSYDADQPGALEHYRQHLRHASEEARAQHYLIIGPWDHGGTRIPQAEFAGLKVGPESLVDLGKLHLQWYAWTMQEGQRPEFLQRRVAYYVMGAEKWRYAESLEAITKHVDTYYLCASENPTDPFHSGYLTRETPLKTTPSHYVYDPRDVSGGQLEASIDWTLTEQRLLHNSVGKLLVFHSAPFEADMEISGFFRLRAWISIDQPDTDFQVSVFEMSPDGQSVFLSDDCMRARYRESLREPQLVRTTDPLLYDFDRFTFISRVVKRGRRLRLVIGPVNSIHLQRNFNTGGVVARESIQDARRVHVRVFHDREHESVLQVPIARPVCVEEPRAPRIALAEPAAPAGNATYA